MASKAAKGAKDPLDGMSAAERRRWDALARSGPHPTSESDFTRLGRAKDKKANASARQSVQIRPQDATVKPDWDEIDRFLAILDKRPLETKMEAARRYVGDTINMTPLQRMICAAHLLLSPRMSLRQIAVCLGVHHSYVQQQWHVVLGRIQSAPPSYALNEAGQRKHDDAGAEF